MLQRAAIVLLVVLNLGAAGWWWLHASPPAEAPAETPAGAARLHLVSETSPAAQAVAAQAFAMQGAGQAASAPPSIAAQPSPAGAAALCEGGTGPASAWRVWLPRLPSADAAEAAGARIGEAGFSDYLVVRDGADANTIALGRYGTEQAAQRRTAALRASGFPARCARIPPATPA